MSFERITESNSNYDDLELKSPLELLKIINNEDQSVAFSVKKELNTINKLFLTILKRILTLNYHNLNLILLFFQNS